MLSRISPRAPPLSPSICTSVLLSSSSTRRAHAISRSPAGVKHHLSSQPQKQGGPQLFFRIAQLVTQRGLGEVQAFARFGHAAFFGHGDQKLEMPDFQFRTHIAHECSSSIG